MNRRTLLQRVTGGIGFLVAAPLTGCRSTQGPGAGFDPGRYRVGRCHMVFDPSGGGFILDRAGHRILDVDPIGLVEAEIGSLGSDGGDLNFPIDANVGADGRVHVLDHGNSRVQVFSAGGEALRTYGGHGPGADELASPVALARHEDRVYVADTLNHRVQVFTVDGSHVGTIGEGELNGPRGVAVDHRGGLHVIDAGSASVWRFGRDGDRLGQYSGYGDEPGEMKQPRSIALSPDGRLFIADSTASRVHVFDENGVFLGRFEPVDADGQPVAPRTLAFEPDGTLYISTM